MSRLDRNSPAGIGRVAVVEVEGYAAQDVVAREQQPPVGLVQDDVRGRVAGRLVHLPAAQVGVHLHAGQQVAVRQHDPRPAPVPGPRCARGSARAPRRARRSGAPPRSAARAAAPGLAAARSRGAWLGCIHSSQPAASTIGSRPGRSGRRARGCRPAGARAPGAARPGRARARAGPASPARGCRCPPAPRRCPAAIGERVHVRHAGPRQREPQPPQARAARGRPAPARGCAGARSRVDQHAGVEDPRRVELPPSRPAARRRRARGAAGRTRGGGRGRPRGGG